MEDVQLFGGGRRSVHDGLLHPLSQPLDALLQTQPTGEEIAPSKQAYLGQHLW